MTSTSSPFLIRCETCLRWMSAPEVFEASSRGNRWESFRNVCRTQFNFDPDKEGVRGAGTALATGKGAWDAVWRRFCEAPQLYPGIGKLLSEPAAPGQGLAVFRYFAQSASK